MDMDKLKIWLIALGAFGLFAAAAAVILPMLPGGYHFLGGWWIMLYPFLAAVVIEGRMYLRVSRKLRDMPPKAKLPEGSSYAGRPAALAPKPAPAQALPKPQARPAAALPSQPESKALPPSPVRRLPSPDGRKRLS